MSTPEMEVQKIRRVIEQVKDSFTRIAGVAHLAEEAVIGESEMGDYDSELTPWNKGWMLRGAFMQIFKEAGAGWNLLFVDFDELFESVEKVSKPQAAAEGVKAPALSALEPEPEPRKLNHYTPGLANAKVSLKAMWGYLEDLDSDADDPGKVRAWAEMIHDELEKCAAA